MENQVTNGWKCLAKKKDGTTCGHINHPHSIICEKAHAASFGVMHDYINSKSKYDE